MNLSRLTLVALATLPALLQGQTVFNDSWLDGGRDDGADPADTSWFTSTSSSAIEVSTGSMGLVSGTSGRGIHGLYTPTSLNEGDMLTLTYSFTTPATVGSDRTNALRVGLGYSLDRSELASDQSLSSSSPNPLFDGLPFYMVAYDVNTGSENVSVYAHDTTLTVGRFMSTTDEWTSLDSGGDPYSFAADTNYVGVMAITRSGADELTIEVTLSEDGSLISSYSLVDSGSVQTLYDMLGFQVNSNTFGSVNSTDVADNGIDFTNITLEYTAVPEPATLALVMGGLVLGLGILRRRRKV